MANHAERIQNIVQQAEAANQQLVDTLTALSDESAQVAPAGAWNAAQIGLHVAMTNQLVSAIFRGDLAIERAPSDDFVPDWQNIKVPEKIVTMPQLEPAADTTRAQALQALGDAIAAVRNGLASLDEQRATKCVDLPFGTINLYMLGEFVAAHSNRHLAQLQRLAVVA